MRRFGRSGEVGRSAGDTLWLRCCYHDADDVGGVVGVGQSLSDAAVIGATCWGYCTTWSQRDRGG